MKAVILIGGKGTRLRPLTCDAPKPLLPVVNRPFLEYQFEILRRHGIREVRLCTSYRPADFKNAFGNGRRLGMKLSYIHEKEPLGTGGAVRNASEGLNDTFLVLNGDVLNTLDITSFLKFHRKNRAEASLALTRVKDPTLYGLVETAEDGRVKRFLEKPSWDEIVTNTINAGAYLFEPGVMKLIPPGVPHSLERSLFPQLLQGRSRMYGYVTPGYWIDIGTVEKYLQVHLDILGGATPFPVPASKLRPGLALGRKVKLGKNLTPAADGGKAALGDGGTVGDFARFSGRVCVGPNGRIGKGASLEDCVVLAGARIGDGAQLKRCVVGPDCVIGANSIVSEGSALAGGSEVRPFSLL